MMVSAAAALSKRNTRGFWWFVTFQVVFDRATMRDAVKLQRRIRLSESLETNARTRFNQELDVGMMKWMCGI